MLASVMTERNKIEKSAEVLRGERLQLEARADLDVYDRLANITCPTFVAAGRYDGIAPPANAEAIAAQIPGAELRVYDAGHALLFQDPTSLHDVVAFLGD